MWEHAVEEKKIDWVEETSFIVGVIVDLTR